MPLAPKTQLGRYEIRSLLGAGAADRQFQSQRATYCARLGQKDEAIAWLQRGYEERDFRMTMISVAWEFDNIRSDPRFVELVRKIGLPQ